MKNLTCQSLRLALCLGTAALSQLSQAIPPPPPANVQVRTTPAEVVLAWDASAEAVGYGIYRAGLDQRWVIVATNLAQPFYRDADFTELPCFYQLAAWNADGESSATQVFTVGDALPTLSLVGVSTWPLSDTSIGLAWTMLGGGDAWLELGISLSSMSLVGQCSDILARHEFTLAELRPATTYYYRLTSAGANGAGFSYWNSFTTRPFAAPLPTTVPLPPLVSPALLTDEDVPVAFTLQASFSPGATLSYLITQPPLSGWLEGTPPNLVYIPGFEKWDADYFYCAATDGVTTMEERIDIAVRPVEDAPVAGDLAVSTAEDAPTKFSLQATDWDSPGVNYVVVSGPTNGTFSAGGWLAPGELQYWPNTNFNGVDHIAFRANDGQLEGNIATVHIRVRPLEDGPVAPPQSETVLQDTPRSIALNGYDPDGWGGTNILTFQVLTPPSHGTLMDERTTDPLRVLYTPSSGYTGPDSFTYRLADHAQTATGVVNLTVLPANHAPVANPSSITTDYSTAKTIVLSGSDPDGDALTFAIIAPPSHGSLSGIGATLTYAPAPGYSGPDSFRFVAHDGRLESEPATVAIAVGQSNAPPSAPSALTATAISRSQINLAWTDHSGIETGFKIERSPDNKGWKQIASVGANVCTYSSKGLAANKIYYYRVRAYNKYGNSAYSSTASARTLP